ncbi:hypothetical protein M413DRAFT_21010 [Hebeloma cylindrosporum]|uniref:Uncharacterized protein n=1 Tax=Hebeloma cylindrosporum TaxID=76867 RepID=A0A0C3CXX2_HEBCY|nr:hypothetical protein M413DRAFT_21010 [Hebeloma cylindrosporum h7]
MSVITLLSLSFLTTVHLAQAKFLTPVCRAGTNYCVQQNSKGTWCYAPEADHYTSKTSITSCIDSGGSHVELQGALQSHLKQNLSIAYYNGVDSKQLGGADYSVPTASGIVRMCLSNSAGDGILQTLCFNVAGDNSVDGFPFCLVDGGPPVVSDGCYPENFITNRTANAPKYSSKGHKSLVTRSILAPAIIFPFVMAISTWVLGINIGI